MANGNRSNAICGVMRADRYRTFRIGLGNIAHRNGIIAGCAGVNTSRQGIRTGRTVIVVVTAAYTVIIHAVIVRLTCLQLGSHGKQLAAVNGISGSRGNTACCHVSESTLIPSRTDADSRVWSCTGKTAVSGTTDGGRGGTHS